MKTKDPKELLLLLHKNLLILEEREAKHGGEAPLGLINQIGDYKQAISLTELVVKDKLSFDDLVEGLKPLNLDIEGGGTQITIEGDEIVGGDKVDGDKIIVGDVANATVAIGERSAAASQGGIAISGNVGGNLIISVGRKEITIPLVAQIVTGFITLGVALLLVSQGYITYASLQPTSTPTITPNPTPTPRPTMTGDFNVAVAQFQVEGKTEEGLEEARQLAQGFANGIEGVIEELSDSIYARKIEIRPPSETGTISGAGAEERAENAKILAKDINADVIIYGTVEVEEDMIAAVKPEFYVSDGDFAGAAEMTGPHRMGSEISVQRIGNKRYEYEAGTKLSNRFNALALVIYGLADFTAGEYQDAEAKFKAALEIKAWDNPDVIYLMLGNTAMIQNQLDQALGHYNKAKDINPNYARAYVGLGNVWLVQAETDPESETYESLDVNRLKQAITIYQKALEPGMDQPPLADIATKVNFGLGKAYLWWGLLEDERGNQAASTADFDRAKQSLQAVIDDFNAGNKRVRYFAAHAHGLLGLLNWQTKGPEAAVPQFEQAVGLLLDSGIEKDEKQSYQVYLDALH